MTDNLCDIARARRLRALSRIKDVPRRKRPFRIPIFRRDAAMSLGLAQRGVFA